MIPSTLTIDALGVRQTRMLREDIELVRQWRTSRGVSEFMFYQDAISPEAQRAWFDTINNDDNHYFIVHFQGRPVGLNYIKEIDWQKRSGQGGIFLVPDDLRDSLFVYRVALPVLDWIYRDLGLRLVTAVTRADNTRAVRYNKSLGHDIRPGPHGSNRMETSLTVDAYRARRPFFVKIFGEWGSPP